MSTELTTNGFCADGMCLTGIGNFNICHPVVLSLTKQRNQYLRMRIILNRSKHVVLQNIQNLVVFGQVLIYVIINDTMG